MKLSQECTLLQSELKKFAQQVLADKVDEIEKSCALPTDNIQRLAEMGIVGAIIPENLGGAALDTIGLAVVLEEISKVCASTAFVIAVHNAFFAYPILKFGSGTPLTYLELGIGVAVAFGVVMIGEYIGETLQEKRSGPSWTKRETPSLPRRLGLRSTHIDHRRIPTKTTAPNLAAPAN